jgi:hypothetical protein
MEDYFSFRTMVSSTIIKIVYTLGALGLTGAGLFFLSRNNNQGFLKGIGLLIIGNLLWRLICEGFILAFSIHDRLVEIREQLIANPQSEMIEIPRGHFTS